MLCVKAEKKVLSLSEVSDMNLTDDLQNKVTDLCQELVTKERELRESALRISAIQVEVRKWRNYVCFFLIVQASFII